MKITILIFTGFLLTGDVIAANETESMDVSRKHGCIACHHPDIKVVGPGWNEITSKYIVGQVDVVEVLASRIRKGSKGVWGDLPMPPNTTITDEEIRTLLRFVLTK